MGMAVLWTIILVLDIITWALGIAPTWPMVFGPVVVVVVHFWTEYYVKER